MRAVRASPAAIRRRPTARSVAEIPNGSSIIDTPLPAAPAGRARWRSDLQELDEIAAGIVEDRLDPVIDLRRLLPEGDAQALQPLVLLLDIGHVEDDHRQAGFVDRALELVGTEVAVRLKEELGAVGILGRGDDRQVGLRNMELLDESENPRIERERLIRVFDENARQADFHDLRPSVRARS